MNTEKLIDMETMKQYSLLGASLLGIGIAGGVVFATLSPETLQPYLETARDSLAPLADLNPLDLFLVLLLNNVLKSYVIVVMGVIFGFAPAFFLLSNGFVIGAFVLLASYEQGMATSLASIIPHGIPELAAVVFAAALGFIMGRWAIDKVRGREVSLFRPLWKNVHRVFLVYILPLFVIAAYVEAFVTPYVAQMF